MIVVIAYLAIALMVANGTIASSPHGMSAVEILNDLRDGRIVEGQQMPYSKLPKPWIEEVYDRRDSDKKTSVYVIRDHSRIIMLFSDATGHLFAAYSLESAPSWSAEWHFCDNDLLKWQIEQSARE